MPDAKTHPIRILDILAVVSLTALLFQLLRTHSFGADYYAHFIMTQSRLLCFAMSIALAIWSVFHHILYRPKKPNLAIPIGVFLATITLTLVLVAILVGWVFPQHPRTITVVFGCSSVLAIFITGFGIWMNARYIYDQIFLVLFLFGGAHLTIQLLAVPGEEWFDKVFHFTYPFVWIFELTILAVCFLVFWLGKKPDNDVSHLGGVASAVMLLLINPMEHFYLLSTSFYY